MVIAVGNIRMVALLQILLQIVGTVHCVFIGAHRTGHIILRAGRINSLERLGCAHQTGNAICRVVPVVVVGGTVNRHAESIMIEAAILFRIHGPQLLGGTDGVSPPNVPGA